MARTMKDFGEKLHGARKDAFSYMHEQGGEPVRDAVWPKEDFQGLLASGIPKEVIFWRNEMRKAVYTRKKGGEDEEYIAFVAAFSRDVMSVSSIDGIKKFYNGGKISSYLGEMAWHRRGTRAWYYIKKNYECYVNGHAVLRYASNTEFLIQKALKKKPFMQTQEEFILSGCHVYEEDGDTYKCIGMDKQSSYFTAQETGNYQYYPLSEDNKNTIKRLKEEGKPVFVAVDEKKRALLCISDKKEDCENKISDYSKHQSEMTEKKKKEKKQQLLPPQLTKVERTGSDYEKPRFISGRQMLSRFHLRGGEYGNWMNEKDRKTSLAMACDAFEDLAYALGLEESDIGLDNLGIGFGSRGRGRALAHFEPAYNVINLTRMRGAGSLAHEWGHALDFYLGKHYGAGGMLSKRTEKAPKEFQDLLHTMKYSGAFKTKFFSDAILLDGSYARNGGYWASNEELFARAFACYIKDKLAENGKKSDYLVGHADTARASHCIFGYPVEAERKRIDAAFDSLMNFLKANYVLHGKTEQAAAAEKQAPLRQFHLAEDDDGQMCFVL